MQNHQSRTYYSSVAENDRAFRTKRLTTIPAGDLCYSNAIITTHEVEGSKCFSAVRCCPEKDGYR